MDALPGALAMWEKIAWLCGRAPLGLRGSYPQARAPGRLSPPRLGRGVAPAGGGGGQS